MVELEELLNTTMYFELSTSFRAEEGKIDNLTDFYFFKSASLSKSGYLTQYL